MTFLCIECGKKLDESNFYKKVKNKCKNCLNKKLNYQICGKFFTKKWMNNHIEQEHQSVESNVLENVNNNNKIIVTEKRNNDNNPSVSAFENCAYVIIGPRNVDKTYYMLKILEKNRRQKTYSYNNLITQSISKL